MGCRGGKPVQMRHYRIDDTHSNAYSVWLRMGSPQRPAPAQYAALEAASELALCESPRWLPPADAFKVEIDLPRQAVSLLQFDWH